MNQDSVDSLSFEEAMLALQQLVDRMETGKLSLEESLNDYERGVLLTRRCQQLLDEAEQRVRILMENKQLADFDAKSGKRGNPASA